jgi:hypothetical protein
MGKGGIMRSPIDQLEERLWDCCVIQLAAQNQETIERWQTDEIAHIKERFAVQEMPNTLKPLVKAVIEQWKEIERKVCSRLNMNQEQFLSKFEDLRRNFLKGNNEWREDVLLMEPVVYGAVRNMDWVNLFAWILPNADKEHYDEYRAIGRMVTALFYVEILSKYIQHENLPKNENVYYDDESALKRIEARWRLGGEQMILNKIELALLNKYKGIYNANGKPGWAFDLKPPIPFVGRNCDKIFPRVLSYASAENLGYVYNDNLTPNTNSIHNLGDKQFYRSRYYYSNRTRENFPYVHIGPFNNGSQLFITRHILTKLGYEGTFGNDAYEFIEQISVANAGKFSIGCKKNKDYAGDKEKMKYSLDYIKADISAISPDIVILPKTIFKTIDSIYGWKDILENAGKSSIDFVRIYQPCFYNNDRISKQIDGLKKADKGKYAYGQWLDKVKIDGQKSKPNIENYFTWVDNEKYDLKKVKSSS